MTEGEFDAAQMTPGAAVAATWNPASAHALS